MTKITHIFVALVLSMSACGGTGTSPGPSGVDSSKQVSAVTDADKGALCDWFAGMVGGYGATSTCADAALEAPPDKASCMSDFPNCAVTIAVFESCVSRMVSAQNTCTAEALTAASTATDCQTVGQAGCFN